MDGWTLLGTEEPFHSQLILKGTKITSVSCQLTLLTIESYWALIREGIPLSIQVSRFMYDVQKVSYQ